MASFNDLIGKWKSPVPWESDDYLSLYEISGTEKQPRVSAVDLNDGESFEVREVAWDGVALTFTTRMPSTGRTGVNRFMVGDDGRLVAEFTFTVTEELIRDVTLRAVD